MNHSISSDMQMACQEGCKSDKLVHHRGRGRKCELLVILECGHVIMGTFIRLC